MGRIVVQPLPGCPDMRLGLINADFPTGPLPGEVMNAVIHQPAYWALCWGSGLGLAQLLYRHPQWVRGRRVLDFGSGSGVVGIAALRNGAASVIWHATTTRRRATPPAQTPPSTACDSTSARRSGPPARISIWC